MTIANRIGRLPELVADELVSLAERMRPEIDSREVGTVTTVSAGVAHISGFTDVLADEHIRFSGGLEGIAASLSKAETGVILLGSSGALRSGDKAHRTGRTLSTLVGDEMLGRIVDPLGRPLDGGPPLERLMPRRIEQRAPEIIDRAPVVQPLQTGIKSIDATIPIGRGQRELILGDRQTGKTAIAIAALVNRRDNPVVGIYCAIGQRATATARVVRTIAQAGAQKNVIVVSTSGDEAPGLQFIAPYAATAMAEHFMLQGQDVVIVYDDLTRHARAYRELSLLLRRPPGREAYPGDIFYVHARLLERATHLRASRGGGSITALPIVETQAGNIAAYIPTNLISITDGQIFLSSELFRKGVLPAIDIGRSVSRIGGKAQLAAYRTVAQSLKLAYSQFEEVESFARFATRLDDETRQAVERGRRVREILKQDEHDLLTVPEQIAVLVALEHGLFDTMPLEQVRSAEAMIRRAVRQSPDLDAMLTSTQPLAADWRDHVVSLASAALERLDPAIEA